MKELNLNNLYASQGKGCIVTCSPEKAEHELFQPYHV